jgi:DNA-binding protein HU-beta
MTKNELIIAVSERSGIDRQVVERVLHATLNEVKEVVVSGKTIYIRGFGSIGVQHRKEKIGQDIRRGHPVVIPAHKVPAFKPSKLFKSEVNQKRIMTANLFL